MKLKKLLSGFIFGAFGLGISLAVFTGSVPNILTRGSTITAVNPNAYVMTQSGNEQGRITVANLFTSAGSGMYLPIAGNTTGTLQNDVLMNIDAGLKWRLESENPNNKGSVSYDGRNLTLQSELDGVQESRLSLDKTDGILFYYADSGYQNITYMTYNQSGLTYGGDYSANAGDRWLVDKGFVEQRVSGLLTYKGAWNMQPGDFPTSPRTGDYYVMVSGGTGGSIYYGTGDMIIANKKKTGTTNSSDRDHVVNTVRPEVDPVFTANSGVYYNNNIATSLSPYLLIANSGTYFNVNSGTYFNTNSGTYYNNNPLGYITGGVLSGYVSGYTVSGGIARPGSSTQLPTSQAVANYIESMSQNLGDIITTGGFYISGATTNRRTIGSGTTYSIQNSTSLLGPWNEVGYFGIGNILFNKHLAVGGYNPYWSGDAMQVSGTSWFMKNISGGMIQGGFAVNVGVLNIGMFGYHPSGVGIYGSTDFGIGVYGEANPLYTGSIGGYFKGPGLSGSAITAEGTINLTGGFAPFRFAYSGNSVVAQFYTGGNRVSATAFTLP